MGCGPMWSDMVISHTVVGLGLARVSLRVRVKIRVRVMVRVSIRTSWVVNFPYFAVIGQ